MAGDTPSGGETAGRCAEFGRRNGPPRDDGHHGGEERAVPSSVVVIVVERRARRGCRIVVRGRAGTVPEARRARGSRKDDGDAHENEPEDYHQNLVPDPNGRTHAVQPT